MIKLILLLLSLYFVAPFIVHNNSTLKDSVTLKMLARCSTDCRLETNSNCTGKCINFIPHKEDQKFGEPVAEECWDIDSCGEFPFLYEFKRYADCPGNCAVYHGYHYFWDFSPILSCLNEFQGANMPNGCELSGKMYLLSWVLLLLWLFIQN